MSNPDLVPFTAQDVSQIRSEFLKTLYADNEDDEARAMTVALGGKPRPPRAHAVTDEDIIACSESSNARTIIAVQNLLGRRLRSNDLKRIWDGGCTSEKINAHFGLTPAPETDEQKWARFRREGINDDEAALLHETFMGTHVDTIPAIKKAVRKVLGIDEAGK